MTNRESVVSYCILMRRVLSDCTALDAEIDNLNEVNIVVAELVKACVKENANSTQSQEEYTKKYNGLLTR